MTTKRLIAVLLVPGMLPWAALHAQPSSTATFRVSARVEESCEVIAQRGATPRVTALRATCTPDTSYLVGLTKRGIATGRPTITGVGTGDPVDHTIFGGVPATQIVPPLDPTDTVSVRFYY